jgi:hypothetical protein
MARGALGSRGTSDISSSWGDSMRGIERANDSGIRPLNYRSESIIISDWTLSAVPSSL